MAAPTSVTASSLTTTTLRDATPFSSNTIPLWDRGRITSSRPIPWFQALYRDYRKGRNLTRRYKIPSYSSSYACKRCSLSPYEGKLFKFKWNDEPEITGIELPPVQVPLIRLPPVQLRAAAIPTASNPTASSPAASSPAASSPAASSPAA
ncbi:hypothetical protein EG328_001810 [Venturia inaequalis]|uniref:Uncharacterized protein n=1 Tax=Venturia inaequalis TaxID=5025 RepID=A0A8H3Z212_VENIN|nr:hypothetical protein EG328_001810 [Venturia inaequalis]RDI81361.1 hypothetical protein Vi05172_g8674 [Venturia inaequalis]